MEVQVLPLGLVLTAIFRPRARCYDIWAVFDMFGFLATQNVGSAVFTLLLALLANKLAVMTNVNLFVDFLAVGTGYIVMQAAPIGKLSLNNFIACLAGTPD
jgi:hypothetical protein